MTLVPTSEQSAICEALDDLLTGADTPSVARSWGSGRPTAGIDLWRRLGEMGLWGVLAPESAGGMGGCTMDAVVALERLGFHAVPGPAVETIGLVGVIGSRTTELVADAIEGARMLTVADPATGRALDADISDTHVITGDGLGAATAATLRTSVDPTRRGFEVIPDGSVVVELDRRAREDLRDLIVLGYASLLLGTGERMLDQAVTYATQRRQFGRSIGEYQAVKHALADVRVALDFVRPLIWGAARERDIGGGTTDMTTSRLAAAAKVAAADAADLSARTALQVHGAIGYTTEYDLSIWLLRTRSLIPAWGTPTRLRRTILNTLTEEMSCTSR